MRKLMALILLLLLPLLTACGAAESEEPFSAKFTIRPEEEPTDVYYDLTYNEETRQLRSDALDAAAVRTLFAQSLFGDEGKTAIRWVSPVRYTLTGRYTSEDARTVSDLAASLRHISGFPDMRPSADDEGNLRIHFEPSAEIVFLPAVDEAGRIQSVQISIPSDWDTAKRSAALHRNLMRACGFFYTSSAALDSVLSGETPSAMLSDADYLLLETLYGSIEPGDTKESCLEKLDRDLRGE